MSTVVATVATVADLWSEGTAAVGVRLAAPALAAAHAKVGQFITVDATTPVALAAAPGHGLELLVKRGTLVEDLLRHGARVPVEGPEGPGYPLAEQAGADLLIIAGGTGIAPLRALLQAALGERASFGAITLLYGQRRASELAYAREHDAWRAAGVAVVPVLSGGEPRWAGARGHVQDVLAAHPPPLANVAAFVCGPPEMEASVTATLRSLGLPAGRVFRNY